MRVNGIVVRTLGTKVEPHDTIDVDGAIARATHAPAYLVLHKPVGVVTTMRDPQGRRTVVDLIPPDFPRIVPVGRLDYDTSGVLLLTNDGDLANTLTHPKFGVEKTYRVQVRGRLQPDAVRALQAGVALEDLRAAAARVRIIGLRRDASVVDVTIHEGRNREVRRIFAALGYPVLTLVRLRFGPIRLGTLSPGASRPPTAHEMAALRALKRPFPGLLR